MFGHNLVATAQVVRALRLALRGGEWSTIESSVAAAVQVSRYSRVRYTCRTTLSLSVFCFFQLRNAGGLAPWSEAEVRQASAEVADRRIQLTVAEAGA